MADIPKDLKEWLKSEVSQRRNQAASRRQYANAGKNLSPADRRHAQAIAEQMAGRKLPKSNAIQDEAHALVQENIAAKLESEAAALEGFIDCIAALETALTENGRQIVLLKNSFDKQYELCAKAQDGRNEWMDKCKAARDEAAELRAQLAAEREKSKPSTERRFYTPHKVRALIENGAIVARCFNCNEQRPLRESENLDEFRKQISDLNKALKDASTE